MIVYKCSTCGAKLEADDNQAGREVKCPDCNNLTEVPIPDYFACPSCGKDIEVRSMIPGQMVRCPHCGGTMVVPGPEGSGTGGCLGLFSSLVALLVASLASLVLALVG